MFKDDLINLCREYGIGAATYSSMPPHDVLDLLDRRAGIGTRGGTRPPEPYRCGGYNLPVNYVGHRLTQHKIYLGQCDCAGCVPVAPERQPAPGPYENHYHHLGADAVEWRECR